ncbi:MAG: hypothetical protein U0271_35560 [Polyangiaceae bacterium]
MNDDRSSRRDFIRNVTIGATALIPAWSLVACSKKLSCTDTSSLKPEETQARTALQYTDAATDPSKTCSLCQLFTSAGEEACGSCSLVKGPIHPKGSCTGWAKKG